jgi:transposase-like protein
MSNLESMRTPNPEMDEPIKRRYHTKQYKIKILKEIEACTVPGGVGAILRREGLYSSTISGWRKQRVAGKLDSPSTNSIGKIYELEKENRKLKQDLEQARLVIVYWFSGNMINYVFN